MTATTAAPRLRPVLVGLGLAGLWAALAFLNSSTTYHIGSLLVAAVVPLSLLLDEEAPSGSGAAAGYAAAGFILAVAVTLLLNTAGAFEGEPLEPFSSVTAESLAGAIIGAVLGFVAVIVRR